MTETALKVEIENLNDYKRKLKIEVPCAEVTQELDRAYRELGKKVKVKGFRPGKVPRAILEMYYRRQIEQEASDALVRRTLGEALKQKELDPIDVSWPEAPSPTTAGQDYRYSVEVEVPPEFIPADYLGLKVEVPEVAVLEEEVDARLENIRQANAVIKPLPEDRSIQAGDFVVLDHQAFFAGEPVEGAKVENAGMEVGTGKFNAEFERHLLGLKAGAEARLAVALPDDFSNPLLAGKVVDFQIKVHEVKEKVVSPLDDDFARNLGNNFQTLADLRMSVREGIIKEKENQRQAYLEYQIVNQLLAAQPFEAPPTWIRQEQEMLLRDQLERFGQQGIDMNQMDQSRMLEALKPTAERRVCIRLVLSRIAAQEGVTVADADVDAALARLAVHSRRDVADLKQSYEKHNLMGSLRQTLLDDKTMRLLLDKAEIQPMAATAQEAEATGEKE